MGNYSDLYCRTNVLLLADVFETFRQTCLRQYGLDLAHFYTSPGLSWDALLKKTGVELELLSMYIDTNNLYGWAMSQTLPTGGFRWVEDCDRLAQAIPGQWPRGLHP